MLLLTEVLGRATDDDMADALHKLGHADAVEYIALAPADLSRHRLRATTDKGTACAIALPRDEKLCNGAILRLTNEQAIVVRMTAQPVIRVRATVASAALELGYLAGNMHWRVTFDGDVLNVAQDGDADAYLARLAPLLGSGRIEIVQDEP